MVFVVHTIISYICDSMRVRDTVGRVTLAVRTYISFTEARLIAYKEGFYFIGLWYILYRGQYNTVQ